VTTRPSACKQFAEMGNYELFIGIMAGRIGSPTPQSKGSLRDYFLELH